MMLKSEVKVLESICPGIYYLACEIRLSAKSFKEELSGNIDEKTLAAKVRALSVGRQ